MRAGALAAAAASTMLAVLVAAPPSRGDESAEGRRVEEIIVTAQRKEEAAEDVPISMSVLDRDFLASQGVTDVREAMLFAPNVKVESAGYYSAPRIRGFTVNVNNLAFEPPAGMALDGVPYTNIAYFQAALFDTERVEVLRGPQGTTFGKNTTAGLIHVISKDPTDELSAFFDLQYGELDRERAEAGVGGPLWKDVVNVRVAGVYDHRDGFIDNTTADAVRGASERQRGRQRSGIRAKLDFPKLFGSDLKVTYEHLELEDTGAGYELWHISPSVANELRQYDPRADFEEGNWRSSVDGKDGRTADVDKIQADWTYELGRWSIDAVAAYAALDDAFDVDLDFSPSPASFAHESDSAPTTTFEVRAISPSFAGLFGLESLFGRSLGSSEMLAGFFFQRREIDDLLASYNFRVAPFLRLTAAAAVGTDVTLPPLPVIPGADALVETANQGFDQTADSIAGFAQFEWRFAERWKLEYGMRLGGETKKARWRSFFSSPTSVLLTTAGLQEFVRDRERSELHFQPKATLGWTPLDDVNVFVHWAKAFKGGGFNAFAYRPVDDELEYDDESTTEWGMDVKTTLLDGRARANLSLYWMSARDFQVLTRLPQDFTLGLGVSKVENAHLARARGFEGDVTLLATSWMTLIGTLGLNDTRYEKFPFNECPADRMNADGDSDPRCDASGRPFPFAPEWNGTLTTLLRYPLSSLPGLPEPLPWPLDGADLVGDFTTEYFDVSYVDVDLDPRKRQPSFFRYRASIGVANLGQGWSLRVVGENLSNEATSIRDGDLFPGVFVAITEQPRLFYGQLRYEF